MSPLGVHAVTSTAKVRIAVLLGAVAVSAVALGAKVLAETRLDESSVDLGPLELRLSYNAGVAFGLGDALPAAVVITAVSVITLAVAVFVLWRAPNAGTVERIAGSAVIGGAAANVLDRARDGVVTDYLHTGWWPTFNLADMFLVTGFAAIALLTGVMTDGAPDDQP